MSKNSSSSLIFTFFSLWRNHLILFITLSEAPPQPPGHPLDAKVPYYLFVIVEKIPVKGIQRHCNAPPPQWGQQPAFPYPTAYPPYPGMPYGYGYPYPGVPQMPPATR